MIYKFIKREETYIGPKHNILQQRTDWTIGGDDFLLELLIRVDDFNKTKNAIINQPEVINYFVKRYTKNEIIAQYMSDSFNDPNYSRYELFLPDWDEFWEDLIF